MSLSSTSGPEGSKNILSQVQTSSPQGVPNEDKLTGKENKQVQQPRSGFNTEMQSDVELVSVGRDEALEGLGGGQGIAASDEGPPKTFEEFIQNIKDNQKPTKQDYQEWQRLNHKYKGLFGELPLPGNFKPEEDVVVDTYLTTLSPEEKALLEEVQKLVNEAISGKIAAGTDLEVPQIPLPKITPRTEVMEIGLALAQAIAALGESTQAAVSNYLSAQAQADTSNKASLEKQGQKIDAERAEFQKMKQLEAKAKDTSAVDKANTAAICCSAICCAISVIVACFTCGAGLLGCLASLVAGAGVTAGTVGGSQVAVQVVVQAVKEAVVQCVKMCLQKCIDICAKEGLKAAMKAFIKMICKAVCKCLCKCMSKGKDVIAKAFPKLSKVMNALASKWVTLGVSIVTAVPGLVKGINQVQMAKIQEELARLQKEVGKLMASSEMMKMFTQFWMQAAKIAAKQTGQTEEMNQQAVKLGAQIGKAFAAISAGLASAV